MKTIKKYYRDHGITARMVASFTILVIVPYLCLVGIVVFQDEGDVLGSYPTVR